MTTDGPALTIAGGRLAGTDEGGLRVYRGIPYAEPPIGPRRWQRPEPKRPWTGTLDASAFGPAAPQTDGPPNALPTLLAGPTDESCLTLNVWAPADAVGAAVLVWIHGGAFLSGGTAIGLYGGAHLARTTGAVVVSANYRLGALGFAPVGGTANLGLLDQLLALEWVRDNIPAFGGDPDRVAVFGESAGGGSVLHLLAAPGAAGVVRRAIVQSGATTLTLSADQIAEVADRVRSGLSSDPMTASIDEILAVQDKVGAELLPRFGAMPFHPAIDDEIVTARPVEAVAERGVDLLIGTTAQELNLYLDPAAPPLEAAHLARRAARYLAAYGVPEPDQVLSVYDGEPSAVWAALRTDAEMWLPAVAIAEANRGTSYAYRFDWPAAPPNQWLGACHAIELPFTFGTFDQAGWGVFVGHDADADTLSRGMQRAWAAFAATGDPSTDELGPWPSYEPRARSTMLFDRVSRVVDDPRGETRAAWDRARRA